MDERSLSPSNLFGATASATAAGTLIALLYKFLAPLFTRISADKALEHPRRQRLFAYIRENPGGTFRELLRGTDIPAGTARHHLNILERTGVVVEKRHKSTLRFFPNHGQYDDTWDAVVMLREEPLAELHGWISDHPECMQKEMLAAMAGRGWSRSTTQHRLTRLIDGGLVTVRPQGRVKRYTAHARAQREAHRDAWTGLTHFTPGEGTPSMQGSL